MCENPRKRHSSVDIDFNRQSKFFVTAKVASHHNDESMEAIHKKTLAMLFKAAKKTSQPPQETEEPVQMQLFANGEIEINFDHLLPIVADKQCKGCFKLARVQTICCTCNLTICEYCGLTCVGSCKKHLCTNCVNVFGCGTLDKPICEHCKMYEF